MIVCDVTQFYSPYGGGVRRYLTEKRRYVVEHTQDEHVLIVPGARTEYTREGRLHTYTIKSPPISATSRYRALLNQRALREILRHVRPDLIESGDPYQVAWTTLHEARGMRAPIVGFYHSHFPEAYLRTAAKFGGPLARWAVFTWAKSYALKLYREFDATLVCASELQGVLRSWGIDNVRAVKLGVDTTSFSPGAPDLELRSRLGVPESAFLLLFVGRLAGEKNVATLLSAFERLRKTSTRDFRLLCVGQGPWREALLETRELTRGAAQWIPHIGNSAQLAKLYRTADLAVHPCVNETFGLVPLEEQACGLAVCGIRGSCLDENIMAGLEYWAPRNDPRELARAIERMAAADLKTIGATAARAVRERYAWPVVLEKLWSIYRELVAETKHRGRRRAAARVTIRNYQPKDRAAVRRICCETGFLGRPIDPVFSDREAFADLMTSYYTDAEPESLFVLEQDGEVAGYLCGSRAHARRRRFLVAITPRLLLRAFARYSLFRYNEPSRRFVRWTLWHSWWETPRRPRGRVPHFHLNVLPEARSLEGTKALIDAYLSYLRGCGENAVYGQMVVYEDRRSDALFARFGFEVLHRREVTKYRSHYTGRVFLCTAWKNLSLSSRLHGARLAFLKEQSA